MSNILFASNQIETTDLGNARVLYETLRNRVTGAHTQVIDLRPQGGKYAMRCVTHGTLVERPTRLPAEAESHKSHTWCEACAAMHREGAMIEATPRPAKSYTAWKREKITLNAMPDKVRTFAGMMPAVKFEAPDAKKAKRARRAR